MWEGQTRPARRTACHKQVAHTARAACGQLYEALMQDNTLYGEWKRQNPNLTAKQLESRFIAKNWPRCIEFARATLAHMLTLNDVPESVNEEILEVLVLDNSVPVGRTPPGRAVEIGNLMGQDRKGWLN